jgi:quercetin 2,3-dioxygenase
MITMRRAEDRGHVDYGWLDSRHTFSFGDYYDPAHRGFRALRVINDDTVAPGGGFPTHGHRDMEIVTYVLEGAIAHRDNLGNEAILRPGEIQRMSAGKGVLHSEFNASGQEPLHLLQIWIQTRNLGMEPSYEQKPVRLEPSRFTPIVTPDGDGGSVRIHQDAVVAAAHLIGGDTAEYRLAPGRGAWVHVARGKAVVNGIEMKAGDGAALVDEPAVTASAEDEAEILLFDLP